MASVERWKKYFDFSLIDNNRTNGHCKLCNDNYKDKNGVFSNFFKHLKRKHSPGYEQIFSSTDENSMKDVVIEDDDSQTPDSSVQAHRNKIASILLLLNI